MEGWKKWYIWIVAVFLLTAVAGKVIMARTPDVGLAGVKTIDELSGRQVKLEYALGDGEAERHLSNRLQKIRMNMSVRLKTPILLCWLRAQVR